MRQLLISAALLAAAASCQGLLGIEDATLRQEGQGGSSGAGQSGGRSGSSSMSLGGEAPSVGTGGEGGDGLSSRFSYERVTDVFIDIVVGSDENFWMALGQSFRRVTLDWEITDFPLTDEYSPLDATLGVDNNVWFVNSDHIGRITPTGMVAEFEMPTSQTNPTAICDGPDTNLWFMGSHTLGRATIAGVIDVFPVAAERYLQSMACSDKGIWITDRQQNAILKIDLDGSIEKSWPVPTANANLDEIVVGPDGNMWFEEAAPSKLGKILTSGPNVGYITEYQLPTGGPPSSMVAAPDGGLWLILGMSRQLIRLTTEGLVTETYDLPRSWKYPASLLVGPDHNLWFGASGNLVRFEL